MEADVLKHNCIAYLLQDYLKVLGQDFTNGDTMSTFEVILGEELDIYTALAKFMEQAMEWEMMPTKIFNLKKPFLASCRCTMKIVP